MDSDKSIHDLLIKIAQEDDQLSFKKLYLHYYQKLLSLVCCYIRNHANAEEVVNEVFVNIWKRRADFNKIQNFSAYIYRAAKNQSLNYIAKNKLPSYIDIDDVGSEAIATDTNAIEHMTGVEFSKQVNLLILQLPQKGRIIFILIKNEGLSYLQVAELLNISVKTVEYHMGACLKKMAEGLRHMPRFMNKSKH